MRRQKRKKKCLIFACMRPLQTDMRLHRGRGPGAVPRQLQPPPRPSPRAHPAAAATPKASGGARPYTAPPCQSSGSTKARGLILPRDAAGAPKTMRGGQRLSPPQGNGERGQNEATLAPKGATRTTRLPPQPRLPSTHRLRAKHRDVASPKKQLWARGICLGQKGGGRVRVGSTNPAQEGSTGAARGEPWAHGHRYGVVGAGGPSSP